MLMVMQNTCSAFHKKLWQIIEMYTACSEFLWRMHRIGAENSTPEPSDELKCFSMLQCSIKRHIYQLSKVYHRLTFEPNAIWQITYTESICRTRGLMVLTYFSSRTYIPSIRSLSRKFFNTSLIHVNKKIVFLPV